MPKPKPHLPWPKLSIDLVKPRHPCICQSCGLAPEDPAINLTRWLECDDNDVRQPVAVVLCKSCAKKLIEPHPRLYHELAVFEPMPGIMDLCIDCKLRTGVTCTSPQAGFNSGPGLNVIYPKPTAVNVCRKRGSGWINIYEGPATFCDGRVEREKLPEILTPPA